MNTKNAWTLTACLSALAGAASANVVAWYRFGELDPGVEATTATVIANAAAPGTLEGTVNTFGSAVGSGGVLPVGTTSFGARLKVWDPLSGQYHESNRAMHFGARTPLAANATGAPGSCYVVPSGSAGPLDTLTNITVEAIFRLNDDVPDGFTACLVDKAGSDGYKNRWGITFNANGMWQRFRRCNLDGTGSEQVEGFTGGSGKVTRGVWHHAAFTFDANGQAALWLDYERLATMTKAGTRLEKAVSQFTIGCNPGVANRTFPGEIDEVRISDCALDASQFLRIKPVVEGLDPDTLFYQPFDYDEGPLPLTAMDINAATNAGALEAKFVYLDVAKSVPRGSSDIPGTTGQLRQHVLAPESANGGSMYSVTGALNKATSVCVLDPDRTIYTNSFTAEMFFKADTAKINPNGGALTLMWGQLKVFLGANGSTAARAFNSLDGYDWQTGQITDSDARLIDGNWHHVAVVYDYAPSNFTYYVDYVPLATKTTRIYDGANRRDAFWFGRQVADDNQHFPGWQDSLRIVRRALKPHEFLTTHAVPAREPETLAHISFDTDFSVEPYPSVERAGTAAAFNASGALPQIDTQKTLGKIWLDGLGKLDSKEDPGSVRMAASQVRFPWNSLFERAEFTVEFFAKLDSLQGTPHFLRLNRDRNNWTYSSTWAIGVNSTTRHLVMHAYMRRFDGTFNDCSPDFTGVSGKIVPDDARWHHYALTSQLSDGTNTTLTAYIDYEPVGQPQTIDGVFWYPTTGTCLAVDSGEPFSGWIDEVRFTDGVRPVASFMRADPQPFTIVVR